MRVMVDMTASILHHGHIRLLEYAKSFGHVIVALTTDEEVQRHKGFSPQLLFEQRREILLALRSVDEVVASPWLISDSFLDEHQAKFLIHGSDNSNPVSPDRLVLVPRTTGISSSMLRSGASE